MKDAREVLLGAVEVLDKRGWHQGSFMADTNKPDTCAVCALGALNAAAIGFAGRSGMDVWAAEIRLHDYLRSQNPDWDESFDGIAEWNDVPGRTKEEVIQALTAAAAVEPVAV